MSASNIPDGAHEKMLDVLALVAKNQTIMERHDRELRLLYMDALPPTQHIPMPPLPDCLVIVFNGSIWNQGVSDHLGGADRPVIDKWPCDLMPMCEEGRAKRHLIHVDQAADGVLDAD